MSGFNHTGFQLTAYFAVQGEDHHSLDIRLIANFGPRDEHTKSQIQALTEKLLLRGKSLQFESSAALAEALFDFCGMTTEPVQSHATSAVPLHPSYGGVEGRPVSVNAAYQMRDTQASIRGSELAQSSPTTEIPRKRKFEQVEGHPLEHRPAFMSRLRTQNPPTLPSKKQVGQVGKEAAESRPTTQSLQWTEHEQTGPRHRRVAGPSSNSEAPPRRANVDSQPARDRPRVQHSLLNRSGRANHHGSSRLTSSSTSDPTSPRLRASTQPVNLRDDFSDLLKRPDQTIFSRK